MGEELLVEQVPEEAVTADEEEVGQALVLGVAFQGEAGQIKQGEVQLAGQKPGKRPVNPVLQQCLC